MQPTQLMVGSGRQKKNLGDALRILLRDQAELAGRSERRQAQAGCRMRQCEQRSFCRPELSADAEANFWRHAGADQRRLVGVDSTRLHGNISCNLQGPRQALRGCACGWSAPATCPSCLSVSMAGDNRLGHHVDAASMPNTVFYLARYLVFVNLYAVARCDFDKRAMPKL